MARKKITDLIAELRSWLPNYDHGPDSFPTTFYRILASLPGGDELEDMGYEPMGGVGWHEADILGRTLEAIQDKGDVEDLVRGLMSEEEEEVGEVREASRRGGRTNWEEIYSTENNKGNGFAPDQDDVRAAFEAYIADGAEPVQRRSTSDDIAVVSVEGDGWILIGGDAQGKNAWAVHINESDSRVEGNGEMQEAPRHVRKHQVSENGSTESHELALYTINDGDIYRQTIQPIIKNLAQKIRNGTYDADLAINAWMYAADAGAKKYTKEFDAPGGPNGSFGAFSKSDRLAAAREIGEQYDEEVQMLAKAEKKSAPARRRR